jgi:hypothetical protein
LHICERFEITQHFRTYVHRITKVSFRIKCSTLIVNYSALQNAKWMEVSVCWRSFFAIYWILFPSAIKFNEHASKPHSNLTLTLKSPSRNIEITYRATRLQNKWRTITRC